MFQNTTVAGYTGNDAELRITATGKDVANFTIAINEQFGENERTTWMSVVCWNGLTKVAKHIKKGQGLLIEGRVHSEAWLDADGNLQSKIVLTAKTIRFLGAKPENK